MLKHYVHNYEASLVSCVRFIRLNCKLILEHMMPVEKTRQKNDPQRWHTLLFQRGFPSLGNHHVIDHIHLSTILEFSLSHHLT